jgi:hypothetical protein
LDSRQRLVLEAGLLIDELQECRRQVGLAATKAQKRATKQQEAAT